MSAPELSVVIPAFNEERRLPATLKSVVEYLRPRGTAFEVLVVDDGSTDGTAATVEAFGRSRPPPARAGEPRQGPRRAGEACSRPRARGGS